MALIERTPWETFWAWLVPRIRQTLARPVVETPGFEHPPRDVVWREDGPDGQSWVEIVRRADGLYSFAEWKRERITAPKAGTWDTEFPLQESGLYASEAEARDAIPDLVEWVSHTGR